MASTTEGIEREPRVRRARRRRRGSLGVDLALLGVVGVVLGAAVAAGGGALYQTMYSPAAFVQEYLDLLAAGRAADALALPGVAPAEADDRSASASDALLRRAALGSLRDARVVAESHDGETTTVRAEYLAGGHTGSTTFQIQRAGSVGILPTWRFAHSPLATIDLRILGTTAFAVNGFTVDKRQLSPDAATDPATPIRVQVLSPGLYSVSVDTPVARTPGVAVLSDTPGATVPVTVQAEATPAFVDTVSHRVQEFLTNCATQEVLQPAGCPFGYVIRNRIATLPEWSIIAQPQVALAPEGNGWRIVPTTATAHLAVTVRSLYDGRLRSLEEDVPFEVTGTVTVESDGAATIVVAAPRP